MTSTYLSYDLSLRYSWVYRTSARGKSSVYLGKLSEQVRIWLLTFLDGTCIQMSCVSFDNATLDYILVIWVCMVRLPPSFLNIFQVPKVSQLIFWKQMFPLVFLCVYEFSLDLLCTFILMYIQQTDNCSKQLGCRIAFATWSRGIYACAYIQASKPWLCPC